MESSITYLKKALEVAEDELTDKSLIPLAETYLNLGNGTSFLNRYAEALKYADKARGFAFRRLK